MTNWDKIDVSSLIAWDSTREEKRKFNSRQIFVCLFSKAIQIATKNIYIKLEKANI